VRHHNSIKMTGGGEQKDMASEDQFWLFGYGFEALAFARQLLSLSLS
jgi:hypothetical protein